MVNTQLTGYNGSFPSSMTAQSEETLGNRKRMTTKTVAGMRKQIRGKFAMRGDKQEQPTGLQVWCETHVQTLIYWQTECKPQSSHNEELPRKGVKES